MTDMKKSRYSEQQIIGFLKQAEAGMPIKELCRAGGFSDATFYKWRAKFGGIDRQSPRQSWPGSLESSVVKSWT
jgi:putative transposase